MGSASPHVSGPRTPMGSAGGTLMQWNTGTEEGRGTPIAASSSMWWRSAASSRPVHPATTSVWTGVSTRSDPPSRYRSKLSIRTPRKMVHPTDSTQSRGLLRPGSTWNARGAGFPPFAADAGLVQPGGRSGTGPRVVPRRSSSPEDHAAPRQPRQRQRASAWAGFDERNRGVVGQLGDSEPGQSFHVIVAAGRDLHACGIRTAWVPRVGRSQRYRRRDPDRSGGEDRGQDRDVNRPIGEASLDGSAGGISMSVIRSLPDHDESSLLERGQDAPRGPQRA